MGEAKRRKQLDPDFGKPPIAELKILEVGTVAYEAACDMARECLGESAFRKLTRSLFYLFAVKNEADAFYFGYAHPYLKGQSIEVDFILLLREDGPKRQARLWWARVEDVAAEVIADRARTDMNEADVVLVQEGDS
jgi:hypothetical protein